MEYKVITASHDRIGELVVKVNEHIEKGWEPLGGISSNEVCMQAMVRR